MKTPPRTERWSLHGGSMRPLGPAWQAEVDASDTAKAALRPGDLVCYLGAHGQPVVHRVHGIDDHRLRVRGDTAGAEPSLPRAAVIGRVVALWRGDRRWPLPASGPLAFAQRRGGLLWSAVAPVIQGSWHIIRRSRSNV